MKDRGSEIYTAKPLGGLDGVLRTKHLASQCCAPQMAANDIINMLLACPLKEMSFDPLFPCQQLPCFLAPLLSSSSNKGPYSVAPTSLLTFAPKTTPAGLAHLSNAPFLVRSPVTRAFTNGGDQSVAFDRWDTFFLLDVIFPLASGQHTSLVSSCLNGCSFSVSVA